MFAAAENLEFEKAARLRDELKKVEALAGKEGVMPADALRPVRRRTEEGEGPRRARRSAGRSRWTREGRRRPRALQALRRVFKEDRRK